MIDTHAHLDGSEFSEDLAQVIARAHVAGIEKILIPAIDAQSFPHLYEICRQYPQELFPMIGLHPENVNPAQADWEQELSDMYGVLQKSCRTDFRLSPDADAPRLVGIGEVGLDFYWDDTYRLEQTAAFERQIDWAVEFDLPLMIHARNAHQELVDVMRKHQHARLRGVFHCFSGSAEEAADLLQFPNFMLGIGGISTFKKSTLPAVLRAVVPLHRIVLETDSPYMAPVPYRGKRNESAFVVEVAKKLAEIYEVSLSEIDRQTTRNVHEIFNIF